MKKIIIIILSLILLSIVGILTVNFYVVLSTKSRIISIDEAKELTDVDCILVLGAGVYGNKPRPMLEDRILTGIELYNNGVAKKIIMSGDHGQEDYDEVNVMKSYAVDEGINSSDIFMDHAGFSTYDSIYRLKEIFEVDKVVIVTQEYHLYRALYIAKELEIEAYGVSANLRDYPGQFKREVREILARDKDLVKVIFKPSSTYVGETIPVTGDGNITNDK